MLNPLFSVPFSNNYTGLVPIGLPCLRWDCPCQTGFPPSDHKCNTIWPFYLDNVSAYIVESNVCWFFGYSNNNCIIRRVRFTDPSGTNLGQGAILKKEFIIQLRRLNPLGIRVHTYFPQGRISCNLINLLHGLHIKLTSTS